MFTGSAYESDQQALAEHCRGRAPASPTRPDHRPTPRGWPGVASREEAQPALEPRGASHFHQVLSLADTGLSAALSLPLTPKASHPMTPKSSLKKSRPNTPPQASPWPLHHSPASTHGPGRGSLRHLLQTSPARFTPRFSSRGIKINLIIN